jgi:adenine-specific DNA-methyltransferase
MGKLELIWPGKNDWEKPEPRILIEQDHYKSEIKRSGSTDNLLIHGDNLLGLKALEKKYSGAVKCIYIDPPYNTQSSFAHYEDGMEHSAWLNMMKERLILLKKLLRENGSIWISIDDSECHYLKVLCDEIFGRKNFIASLPTIMNLKGNHDQFGFSGTHEYTLVYAKNKTLLRLNHFQLNEEEICTNWDKDEFGFFKKADTLRRTGEDAPRSKRPKGWFPIFITLKNEIYVTENDKPRHPKDYVLWPINSSGEEVSWTWSKATISSESHNLILVNGRNGKNIYKKQRPQLGELPTRKPKSLFYKPEYSSGHGTSQLRKLFGSRSFDYPKSEYLISDFILLATNPGDLVLDCFAGSGTTGAVAHKMGRRWIMIEINGPCQTHIIPRLKRVINGTDQGGISTAVGWEGGGGFRFCQLAPSLLERNHLKRWVVNRAYNPSQLAEAICLHTGYEFNPNFEPWWLHGKASERKYLHVSGSTIDESYLKRLTNELSDREMLLVYCAAFRADPKKFPKLTIKKIPKGILAKCEWGKDPYSKNLKKALKAQADVKNEQNYASSAHAERVTVPMAARGR